MKKCEKVRKIMKNYETILPFSCCPLVFPWLLFAATPQILAIDKKARTPTKGKGNCKNNEKNKDNPTKKWAGRSRNCPLKVALNNRSGPYPQYGWDIPEENSEEKTPEHSHLFPEILVKREREIALEVVS